MKAICLINDGASQAMLVEEEVPIPEPGPGEVLIKVSAAGVTHTELTWDPTLHRKSEELRPRPIPAHEFSGLVAALGNGAEGVGVGDEVYGMNDWFADGALAEYCLTLPASIAPKPSRLSHAEAASVPIGALTSWQGLFDRANLRAGERVLVQGGAGGVGIFAVQLAHPRGAHVVATAAPKNFEFVSELGAQEVIDYRSGYFGERADAFDVVFDVIGGETLQKSWALLKPGGRMVTIASDSEGMTDEKVRRAFFIVADGGPPSAF